MDAFYKKSAKRIALERLDAAEEVVAHANETMAKTMGAIDSAKDKLKNTASNFANGIKNGLKSAFGIHSPSKLMKGKRQDYNCC